jgi:hypothetical protein
VLLPSLHLFVGILSVGLLIFLNAVGNVVTLLLLHQLFVIVINLVTHSLHNLLHAGITSSDLFKSHLLLSLSSSHLSLDSFGFYLLEILVGDGTLLSIFFVVFYHFESSSFVDSFLGSKAFLIFGKVELKFPNSILLFLLGSVLDLRFPVISFGDHALSHLFLLEHFMFEGGLLLAFISHLTLSFI